MRNLSLLLTALSLSANACSYQNGEEVTSTPRPGVAQAPSAAPASTVTPGPVFETETAAPDLEATAHFATSTALVEALVATSTPNVYASYVSPDRKWRAEVVIYDCTQIIEDTQNSYEQLKLIQVATGAEYVVAGQLLYCGGLGAAGLDAVIWSPNSRYLYYTDARDGLPDGLCGYWMRPIDRVDVTTRTTEPVGAGHLSPDKSKLAFWQQDDIVVWDLDRGELGRVQAGAPGAEHGDILWSPDSSSLLYLEMIPGCPPSGVAQVTLVESSGLDQKRLFESQSLTIESVEWEDSERLRLTGDRNETWHYDLVTGELKPIP